MIKLDKIFNPKMLSALAVAGVVATAIMGAIEGMSNGDELKETVKTAPKEGIWAISKHYIPRVTKSFWKTIVVGGITMACIVTSCYLSGLQIVALSGTIAGLISQRDAVEKEIVKLPGGKEALAKVKTEIAQATAEKKLSEKPKPWTCQTIEQSGDGDDLFLDYWSGRMFLSCEEAVRNGIEEFNAERDEGTDLPCTDTEDMNLPLARPYADLLSKWHIERSGISEEYGYPANDDYYEHRWLPYTIDIIPVEKLGDKNLKKLGKDLHVISIEPKYYPMPNWNSV